jgi:hypothetical protein
MEPDDSCRKGYGLRLHTSLKPVRTQVQLPAHRASERKDQRKTKEYAAVSVPETHRLQSRQCTNHIVLPFHPSVIRRRFDDPHPDQSLCRKEFSCKYSNQSLSIRGAKPLTAVLIFSTVSDLKLSVPVRISRSVIRTIHQRLRI